MNTQSHALMGALFFGRGISKRAWVGLLGGITPDIPMIVIVLTLFAIGIPGHTIFDEMYWQRWWQITNAIGHSFLLWGAVLAVSLFKRWTYSAIFSASALLHTSIDFLCHREDAHMSFWPLSDYKFMSPVSYYDRAHYGGPFSVFEAVLGLLMAGLLSVQFKNWLVRGALTLCAVAYLAVPLMFIFSMH